MHELRRIRLQRPRDEDADDFLAAVARSSALHRHLATPPSNAGAYAEYVRRAGSERHCCFLVRTQDSGELAGVINISEIVLGQFQSAYLGYYAFVPFAGQGYMRAGLTAMIDHAFGELGLHRLEANIQPDNERSIALVRGLGFEKEGYSPKYLKIAGRWRDHERWAIRSDNWSSRRWKKGEANG